MTRVLAEYARQHGCVFTVNGKPEPEAFLFSPEVFLPVIAMHANMAALSILNKPLGLQFNTDDQALFGVSVSVDPLTGDEISVMRVGFFTCALHQVFGLAPEIGQIECAPVFEAYQHGLMHHIERSGGMQWPLATVSPR